MKEKIETVEEVGKLIISFSKQKLTKEEKDLCLHIWKKLTRKQKLDITRTRPDIWAAAVIWTFCRANFKYEEGITLDVVCNFFNNKKSTVGNKAGEIVELLKIGYFLPEFSTKKIQEKSPLKILAAVTDDVFQELEETTITTGNGDSTKRIQAENALDKGIDLLEGGNEEGAGRYFLKSIEIDPTYADGYNHLANIAWRKANWKRAEGLYRKAYDLAEPEVKDITKGDFWGVLESRPYMRALHGLGLTQWKLGRLEEARGILGKMLDLNSNDNQGVRYLIGPIYHQMGNLDKAIEWYVRNLDDPHNVYNYGLALIQQHELEVAVRMLISGIFKNPYIAPMLLTDRLPESDWWHDSSWAEPQCAEDYVSEYRGWWEKDKSALKLLRTTWCHGIVRRTLKEFISIRRQMTEADTGEERVRLGRESDELFNQENIMGLARKIHDEFTDYEPRQMELF